MNCYFTCQKLS